MTKSITIRTVPDATRNELAARAARAGKSLQEYLLGELIELAEKPNIDTWLERVSARVAVTGSEHSVEEILGYRDSDKR